MQLPAKPPLHWIFRLIRALVLLALAGALLAVVGFALLSWGFYNAGQSHLREMEAERRQQGLPQATDTTTRRPARPRPTR